MTQNGGYTIEVDPDKLDELASGIGTAEMKCSFALSKLKWGMGSIAADIAGVGGGNINHLQEKFEGSIKKYKDLLDDSQAFVKKTAADVRQLDQSWQAKLGRTVGEFSGWYDLQRTFGEYDPQTGEKITGGQRAEAGVMTILNFSPGKAIGVFAKGGKMAKTAKIGQEASALGKIKSGRKAVNPAVFKDFFSGAWNSMKGRFRSAKEYIVKGKEAVKRVRENIGNVKVPVGVRVADTGMGARMIVPEKRSLKELGQQFAVKVRESGSKGTREGTKGIDRARKPDLESIEEFVKGNKKFEDVLDDYALIYGELVKSNKPWSWQDDFIGKISAGRRKIIKERALGLYPDIPTIEVQKVKGLKFGYADFKGAGVVLSKDVLPERLWLATDREQFNWLNERLPNKIQPEGTTWHHKEKDGEMELVPFGIHNITKHNGGRTKGHWADAPRH